MPNFVAILTDYDFLSNMTEPETLFIFEPFYKSVIWGGDKIAALKHLNPSRSDIGESWEISAVPGYESVVAEGPFKGLTVTELIRRFGADIVGKYSYSLWGDTFPLLVKIIDAKKNLSIQVHPDDKLALSLHNSRGKTEMWYIMDAAPDSRIYSGLTDSTDIDDFCKKSADGSIIDSLACFPVKKGQFYYIPAGTVHAIGAGVMVVEIQETSDISYRIFDYDRLDNQGNRRPLHIDVARKAVDLQSGAKGPVALPDKSCPAVVDCEFFRVDYVDPLSSGCETERRKAADDSFSIIMAVHGDISCVIAGKRFFIPVGTTALVPACVDYFEISANQPYLIISLPHSNP